MSSILVVPSRCTSTLPDDLDQSNLVCELKMDGSRYVMYLGHGIDPYGRQPLNALLSRRVSTVDKKHVDRTLNVPHILGRHYPDLDGTVLDGEMFLKDFPTTQSIMGSGPAVAKAKMAELGAVSFYAFDCPVFRGQDIRGRPLSERRKILRAVIERAACEHLKLMPQWPGSDATARFLQITGAGGEGLIVKDQRFGYGVGWSKMKKSYEVSCFVSGYKPGNGKYRDQIGAIALSVYKVDGSHDDPLPVEIGFASGFIDSVRAEITADPKSFLGRAVDVYAQEVSKDGRLRHPTFYRWRDDLNAADCTLAKLRDDLAKAAKSKRWRE